MTYRHPYGTRVVGRSVAQRGGTRARPRPQGYISTRVGGRRRDESSTRGGGRAQNRGDVIARIRQWDLHNDATSVYERRRNEGS